VLLEGNRDLAELLSKAGHAKPYTGKGPKPDWCSDVYSGAAFGVLADEDDFVISPRITNCQATAFVGSTNGWATILSLDGSAGQYNKGGRGIRDAMIRDLKGWTYFYQGVHMDGALGCDVEIELTSMQPNPATVTDVWIGGIPATATNATGPGYSNTVRGSQLGKVYFEHSFNVLVSGGVEHATFGVGSLNNEVVAPTDFAPTLAGGSGMVNGRKYPA
jgi:hypothetical protein